MFIVYSIQVNAQVNIGILGCMNIANVDLEPIEGKNLTTQKVYGFGCLLDVKILESISICSEPMYLRKGTKCNDVYYDVDYKLTYLEVPVLFKYDFVPYENDLYLLAGPTLGYRINAKMKISIGYESEEIDIKDETKDFDFGISFGGGGSVPMGNTSIFFEARYCIGLKNVYDDPENPDTEIKTKDLLILAGVYFPL